MTTGPPTEPTEGPLVPEIPPPPPDTPLPSSAAIRRNRTPLVVAAAVVALIVVASVAMAISHGGNDHANAASTSSTASPSPGPSLPPLPAAPQSVKAHAKPFAVTLTWQPGVGGGTVGGYTVYRDHKAVGVVQGSGSSYVDKTALPESAYLYEVETYGIGSDVVSAGRSSVQVRTPTAPVALARFAGTFNVRLHVTSHYGVTGVKDTTAGWKFIPNCGSGPCNAKLVDIHHQLPTIMLKRTGAQYEGSGSGQLGVTCSGTKLTSTVHVSLHVTDAASTSDEWQARTFEGTFSSNQAAALGCVSGGVTWAASGKSLRKSGSSL